ncbi:MAG: hypothetical protein FJ356_00350 [Thaumarchaeota archaeon]|nr:hypothetical protein [Nitrososphaerota archaeon]
MTTVTILHEHRFFLFTLIGIGFAFLIFNFIDEQTALLFTDLMFVFSAASLVVLSIIIATKNRFQGFHGKAWTFFAAAMIFWFMGEVIWTIYQQVYKIDPWPSEADFFWLVGYPIFFGFLIYYQMPIKKAISKKMVIISTLIAVSALASLLFISYDENLQLDFEYAIGLSYPVFDSIMLIPALIGVFLFFRGKVNFMWTMVSLGFLCFVIADYWFLLVQVNESYYVGHPYDMLYTWAYALFGFGVYNHLKIFQTKAISKLDHN